MKKLIFILPVILLFTIEGKAQSRWAPFINTGYVTNLQKSDDVTRADAGGSIRVGILNKGLFGKGRLGFYAGYLWFKEYHQDYVGFDDSGSVIMAGVDFMVLRKGEFQCYLNMGLGLEKYTSTYPNNTTFSENELKPDFGLLFNIKKFNAFVGWQPSDPSHINVGIGLTFAVSTANSTSDY